jgi:adenylate cyclase
VPRFPTPEDEWRAYLDGTHPSIVWGRRLFGYVPSAPRCVVCFAPFGAPGGPLFRRLGFTPWVKNPNVCLHCLRSLEKYDVMGAEVEISFLFADVRGSSDLARSMDTMEFTHLMQRFYAVANDVLLANGAILDKFVGDEVVGFFLPFMTGPDHAGAAVRAARELLLAVGSDDAEGPWLPLGAGVNTGTAFVGMVSRGSASEFTAFGDPINIAAHVASVAQAGEILVTDPAALAAGLGLDGLEQRRLSLKGQEVDARVVPVSVSQA